MAKKHKRTTLTAEQKEKQSNRLIKARAAMQQRKAVLRVKCGLQISTGEANVELCLSGLRDIIQERVRQHRLGLEWSGSNSSAACFHLAKIGSSQVAKLCQPSFDIAEFHKREYYRGARMAGLDWELMWKRRKFFDCEKRYKIISQKHEPFRTSRAIPWLCATPDFVSLLQEKNKAPFWAVIEVKSVESKIEWKKFESQLRVSMHCFGIETGFLVVYVKSKNSSVPIIRRFSNKNWLMRMRDQLEESYFCFLSRCIGNMFATEVSIEQITEVLKPVLPKSSEPSFKECFLNQRYIANSQCYYNGNLLGVKIIKKRPKFIKGTCQPFVAQQTEYGPQ